MPEVQTQQAVYCAHCGDRCRDLTVGLDSHSFCCSGCRAVWQILHENQLEGYYTRESAAPGIRPKEESGGRFAFLDDPTIHDKLIEFSDSRVSRLTLSVPQMHCSACVWLIENLHRLDPGVVSATVHFPRREVMMAFEERRTSLRSVVELLVSLGYEPTINLDSLDGQSRKPSRRSLYTKIGVAGFAFGNIMLLAFPNYLSSLPLSGTEYPWLFGFVSLGLALPVLLYAAQDFFVSAWVGLRQRTLNIDVPLAAGFLALFGRSAYEVFAGIGPGYLDSFSGLVFFLLLGRLFQQKTYDALSFERDYKSYFPVSVIRKDVTGETSIPLSKLAIGDSIVIRNQELIPADGVLTHGEGHLDYSFVTGESDLLMRRQGERVYAGGRQCGASIEMVVTKAIEQSYLTRLWNHASFTKGKPNRMASLADTVAKYFTVAVLTVALATAIYWATTDASRLTLAVVSVLVVACPCALALASPFVLGTALRIYGRHDFYLKNVATVEHLAAVRTIIFDKTGTLTMTGQLSFTASSSGSGLSAEENRLIASLARHSTHPLSRRVAELEQASVFSDVTSFDEKPGHGIVGIIDGLQVSIGSCQWIGESCRAGIRPAIPLSGGSTIHVAIDGDYRGFFTVAAIERIGMAEMLRQLSGSYGLALVSGDTSRERSRFEELFGPAADLRFEQSPEDKLMYVAQRQASGHHVAMVGDGLNDAGALQQAEVGIAVATDGSTFTPASDAIISASGLDKLPRFFRFARRCRAVVVVSFVLSLLYNVVGLSFAASGHLTPLISAILMPVSSVSVVLLSTLGTRCQARREGLA